MKDNINIICKRGLWATCSQYTLFYPDIMCLKNSTFFSTIKFQYTVNLKIINLRWVDIYNHIPFIRYSNIFASSWESLSWPICSFTPKSIKTLPWTLLLVLWACLSASNTININPFCYFFITTTYANK